MFDSPPALIALQQPLEDPLKFAIRVYEVELVPLRAEQGSFILKQIKLSNQEYKRGIPFMHKGFFDCHLHVSGMAWTKDIVDLKGTLNPADLVKRLETSKAHLTPFVSAFGWNESDWKITSLDLNQVFHGRLPEHVPILAKRICAHSALINESFKKWIGLEKLPTFITDKDLILVESRLPPLQKDVIKKWLLSAQDELISQGITAVGDMSLDQNHVNALREIANEGLLKIDFQGVIDAGRAPEVERFGPQSFVNANNLGPLDRPARVQVRHWKKYLDGSFGSRSAWLSRMYSDHESYGDSLEDLDRLTLQSSQALKNGFYLSFHVIGDAALDQALKLGDRLRNFLSTHAQLSGDSTLLPSTHRLEHVQLIREDQMLSLERQNFWTLCLQPHHRVSDSVFSKSRLGSERLEHEAYRLGSLRKRGIPFGLSSDAPIDVPNPLKVIEACLRDSRSDENLTFEEILWSYTTGSRLRLGLHPGQITEGSTVFLTPFM